MTLNLITFVCGLCGRTTTTLPDAQPWCSHKDRLTRQKPELMKPKEKK